jgi:hypothetical protein
VIERERESRREWIIDRLIHSFCVVFACPCVCVRERGRHVRGDGWPGWTAVAQPRLSNLGLVTLACILTHCCFCCCCGRGLQNQRQQQEQQGTMGLAPPSGFLCVMFRFGVENGLIYIFWATTRDGAVFVMFYPLARGGCVCVFGLCIYFQITRFPGVTTEW